MNIGFYSGVALLVLSVGCGGSGSSGAGSGSSKPLVASTWGSFTPNWWRIRVASFPNVCAVLNQMTETANSNEIEIDMTAAAGQTSMPPGTYTATANNGVAGTRATFKVWDGSCNKTVEVVASSGTVTLSSPLGVSGQQVDGTYDLQFSDGSHRSGAFSAASCNVIAQGGAGCSK